MGVLEELSLESTAFRVYAFWVSILAIKMLLMSAYTATLRKIKPTASTKGTPPKKSVKASTKIDIERVRRAHLNDLENIPVFVFVGLFYLLTGPSSALAIILYSLVGICRIVHTVVFAVVVIPQPARGIAFGIPILCTFYMAVQTALHYSQ